MGLDSPIAGRVGEKQFFSRIAAILLDGLWGLPTPTPREYRGLRAPNPRGSGLVGAARPHAPGVSGAARPRTPRFTFGRPKVNRKTAKTNGFGFLCLNQSLLNSEHLCTELGFCHLIYSRSIDDASAAAL